MDKLQIAWAAGIFEGEGCIHSGKSQPVALSLDMTDKDVVERFHIAIGGLGVLRSPKRPKRSNGEYYRTQYRWGCYNFEHVQAILAAFWVFLGERRRARAGEVLTRAIQRSRGYAAGLNRNLTCSTVGCDHFVYSKGLCHRCYLNSRREVYASMTGRYCSCGSSIDDGSRRTQCRGCESACKRRYQERRG